MVVKKKHSPIRNSLRQSFAIEFVKIGYPVTFLGKNLILREELSCRLGIHVKIVELEFKRCVDLHSHGNTSVIDER